MRTDDNGAWRFGLYVHPHKSVRNPETFALEFEVDREEIVEIALFAETEPYLLMGFIPASRVLLGPKNKRDRFFLLGGDKLGRDVFSRMIHGTRVSMSIGLVGVGLSLVLAV